MGAVSWKAGTSGNWNKKINWNTGALPGSNDDVTIGVAGTYTVSLTDSEAAHSLTLSSAGAVLDDTGTLTLGGTLALNAGTFKLDSGGTLQGGTVVASGGTFLAAGGTLDGVTYQGTLGLSQTNASMTIRNGLTMTGAGGTGAGTINLTGGNAYLDFYNTQTLDNATINIGNGGSYNYLWFGSDTGNAETLTLGPKLSIVQTGAHAEIDAYAYAGGGIVNQGTISAGVNGGQFGINNLGNVADIFTNQGLIAVSNGDSFYVVSDFSNTGTITVNSAGSLDVRRDFSNSGKVSVTNGATLSLSGNWSNAGTISETNATLNLGSSSTATLNTLTRSGGTVNIVGTLDNTGATLAVGTGTALGALGLQGTILNGRITNAGGGLVFAGGTLDGVTYQGTLDLSPASSYLAIRDGLTVTGAGGTGAGTINLTGANAELDFYNTQSLDNATINIGNNGSYDYLWFYSSTNNPETLTFGPKLSIMQTGGYAQIYMQGNNYYGGGIVNQGTISAGVNGGQFSIYSGYASNIFTNQGLIAVSNGDYLDVGGKFSNAGTVSVTNGGTLSLSGNWSNTGTISETNATIDLGSSSTATLNTLTRSGGTVNIVGTLDNTGTTLAVGTGTALGALGLQGTILNGRITNAGGGLVFAGGTLDGVTYQGTLDLSPADSYLAIRDWLTVTGAGGTGAGIINLTGNSAFLDFYSTQTLDNATVNIGNGVNYDYLRFYSGTNNPETLTFGPKLSIVQTGSYAQIYAYATYGGGIVNQGTISAGVNGGQFGIYSGYAADTFTNQGLIAVSNGDSLYVGNNFSNTGTITVGSGGTMDLTGATLSNLSGTKLTGGTWSVSGASTLQLANNTTIATLNADLTLSGAGSVVQDYNTTSGKQVSFDTTLRTITNTGALHLLGGRSLTTTAAITDQGLLELRGGTFKPGSLSVASGGTLLGYGTVNAATTDAGLIEANGGKLTLAAAASGTGGLQIDAGATLELAGGSALTTAFNGLGATLQLDNPSLYTGAITGLAAGDRLLLQGANATGAAIANGTLTVSLAGGGSLTYGVGGNLANTHIQTIGGSNSTVTLFRYAQPSTATPQTVAFGNHHVGDTASQAITVANLAAADGYSENLDASLSGSGFGFIAGGSFTGLAAGGSNAGALSVALAGAKAGAINGQAVLALSSDGAGVNGLGTTSLGSQTLAVTGALYAYAAPTFSSTTINLGAARVGGAALTGGVTLTNGTVATPYQESLIYGLSTSQGALSFSSASGTVLAGGAAGLGVSLSTASSGDFTGTTVNTALTSTGAGTSGLADTSLGTQAITVNAQVYAAAVAQLAAYGVNFGIVHVGDAVGPFSITLTNAVAGALVDLLTGGTASLSGYSGSVTFSLGSGLASGQSGSVSFGLDTAAAGVIGGSAALSFLSHDGVLADLAVGGGSVAITGTIDNYATAEIHQTGGVGKLSGSGANIVLDLGSVKQGSGALIANLGVLNAALGQADLLGGSFSISGSSAFANAGFGAFSGIAAGQAQLGEVISLSTSKAGVFTETIVLAGVGSNASGYSGGIGTETITVTGTITPSVGPHTYVLTTGADIVNGGPAANTIKAAARTLSSGDQIDGGSSGQNKLLLTKAGVFDLRAPTTLANVQTLNATESSKGNVVWLRDGLNLAVNVAAGGTGSIILHGAADSDTFQLGSGNDTVFLGSASESVIAGSGTALVRAVAATAGALVTGNAANPSGTTLQISGGGSATLNDADSNLVVKLTAGTQLALGKANFITAIGSGKADTLIAGGPNQVLAGGLGADTLIGGTGFATIFRDSAAGLNGDTIRNFAGASIIDVTDVAPGVNALGWTAKGPGSGTLNVSDGTHTAAIKMIGSYSLANFQASADGHGGTQIAFLPGH